MKGSRLGRALAALGRGSVPIVLCLIAGCSQAPANRVQGYVEGEFVYVASPLAGTVESLSVARGTQVQAGSVLFTLESASEKAARDEAERRLEQARSNLEDARKGRRPSEIESAQARLQQAQAALVLSEREAARQEQLFGSGATSAQDADRARSAKEQNRQLVAQLEAELKTAQLGARTHQLEAAEANMRALEASLTQAEWHLAQKRRTAPQDGLVFDAFYREGEWVAAGRPVVALLPPRNLNVRAFVPETQLAAIHHGDDVRVTVDGVAGSLPGKVSFISPRAEYTPPVIYSQENRRKLVFMIEIAFDLKTAASLHPGQPVDVEWAPKP